MTAVSGKVWPGPWGRNAFNNLVRRAAEGHAVAGVVKLAAVTWWVRLAPTGDSDRKGTAPTEAEAMAAADEALFQMLVGVGPWTNGLTGWFRGYNDSDEEGDQAVIVRRSVPPLTAWEWFAYDGPGDVLADPVAKGEAGSALLGRAAADAALRRLAGYPDDATTAPPSAEPTPAPAPEPAPAPAPLLADGPEPIDPEALYWCIQARMMLAHVADGNRLDGARDELGTPISHDALLTAAVATLRQYGQAGTVQAFEAGRLAQHQAEESARQQMAEALARREVERLTADPIGVAIRLSYPTVEEAVRGREVARQAGLPEGVASAFERGDWIAVAWPKVEDCHIPTARATPAGCIEFLNLLRTESVPLEIEPYSTWS
jgi:hypothetical protein